MQEFCYIRTELARIDETLKEAIHDATFHIHQLFRQIYLINAERIISVICGRMHEFNTALPSELEWKLMRTHLHFACMTMQHAIENTPEEELFIPGIKALVDVINRLELAHI